MGLARERLDALVSAAIHAPARLPYLCKSLARGNPALREWCRRTLDQGFQPVVICRLERLGDVVACTPVARHLKVKLGAKTRIAWVCASDYAFLLHGNPDIDEVFIEPCLTTWWVARSRLPPAIIVVELFLDTDRCCWTGLRMKQRSSGITTHNYYGERRSLLSAYSGAAGYPTPDDLPRLTVFEQERFEALDSRPKKEKRLAVHFFSRNKERSWNAESAACFCRTAAAHGWKIVELGKEQVVASRLAQVRSPPPAGGLNGQLSALARADLFVGVDSGFAHCANALRIPALVLLGQFRSFPDYFPYSGNHAHSDSWRCLRSGGSMEGMSAETVWKDFDDFASMVARIPGPVRAETT